MSDTTSTGREVEFTTKWMRSVDGSTDCICCEGAHVFAYLTRDVAGATSPRALTGSGQLSVQGWFNDAVRSFPEGARVRLSIEVIAHPGDTYAPTTGTHPCGCPANVVTSHLPGDRSQCSSCGAVFDNAS
jgi:hypothetical protein